MIMKLNYLLISKNIGGKENGLFVVKVKHFDGMMATFSANRFNGNSWNDMQSQS